MTNGGDDFRRLAARLERAADNLPAVLTKVLAPPVEVAVVKARRKALTDLPRRGGLASAVAGSRITVTPNRSRSRPGVRVEAVGGQVRQQLALINRGQVRHAIYGKWRRRRSAGMQSVRPGWFSVPMEESGPDVRAAIIAGIRKELQR
jgi:hypothetical protein